MREDGFYWALIHSTFDQYSTPLPDVWGIVQSQGGKPIFWGLGCYEEVIVWGEKVERGLGAWKSKITEMMSLEIPSSPNESSLGSAFSVISAIFFSKGVLPDRLLTSSSGDVGVYYLGKGRYCFFEEGEKGFIFAATTTTKGSNPQVFSVSLTTLLKGAFWGDVEKFLSGDLDVIPIP